jgi:hypothetical protein
MTIQTQLTLEVPPQGHKGTASRMQQCVPVHLDSPVVTHILPSAAMITAASLQRPAVMTQGLASAVPIFLLLVEMCCKCI